MNTLFVVEHFPPQWQNIAVDLQTALFMLLSGLIAYSLSQRLLLPLIARFVRKTQFEWDDVFFEHRVFHIIPYLAGLSALSPFSFINPQFNTGFSRSILILILIVFLLTLHRILNAIETIYNRYDVSREKPIKTYFQVIMLVLCLGVALISIGIIFQQSVITLISGLGAITAVLMLIFKDPISGFVAGIQLTVNHMIRLGDWIEMPDYKADGEVIEINMTTLKVRNWDFTITTIPVQALTAGSFRNWRGMTEMGGRRIKRSLLIDVRSISFCSDELLSQLQQMPRLQHYLSERRTEIALHNQRHGYAKIPDRGGRQLTNIGLFRQYTLNYLREQAHIHQDMPLMVRQLQPHEFGLPLEIYAFSRHTAWIDYENLQSDIFDHLIAMVPAFQLRLYQRP